MLIAEYSAGWLGMELKDDKLEEPRSATPHLRFTVDLKKKIVAVSAKHCRKVVSFFERFLLKTRGHGGLPLKAVQRILGLQIWLGNVHCVARQFLTSVCDLLRAAGNRRYIYPRKHSSLIAKVVADLTFWHWFVNPAPSVSFDFLLNRLPMNKNRLACDASTG